MADKIVEIPGVGNVAFPDTMSDDEISAQAGKLALQTKAPDVRFPLLGATEDTKFAGTQAGTKTFGVGGDDFLNRQSVPAQDAGDRMKEWAGRASNAFGMGSAGVQGGAPFGPWGAAAGGVGMGLLGLLLPPSQTPGMDTGANVAELAANAATSGTAGNASKLVRMLRAGATTGAMMGGGLVGSNLDSLLDGNGGQEVDTKYGKVLMYGALAAPMQGLKAMTAPGVQQSTTGSAADRLATFLKTKRMPLNASEDTTALSGLTAALTAGTQDTAQLARLQSQYAQDAVEKLLDKSLSQTGQMVDAATDLKYTTQQTIRDWARKWKAANKVAKEVEVDSGVSRNGVPVMRKETQMVEPIKVNWEDFEKEFGLSRKERDALFRAVRSDPGTFVDQLMPGRGPGAFKGILRLRTLMKVLPEDDAQKLGTATVMRLVGRSGALEQTAEGPIMSGAKFASAISDAEPQLELILGKEKTAAMKDLALVMKVVDPSSKVNPGLISEAKRTVSYIAHRGAFAFMTAGGLATAGSHAPIDPIAGAIAGGAVGTAVLIPTMNMIGVVLNHPKAGQILIRAAQGDAEAVNRFLRIMVSAAGDDTPSKAATSSRDRLEGLFHLQK